MRPGSWLVLSGGFAAGLGGTALTLAAQASAGMALATFFLASSAAAGLALLSMLRAPVAAGLALPSPATVAAGAAPRDGGGDGEYGDKADGGPVLPVIAFASHPVVSLADGSRAPAVAIEALFRRPDHAYVTPDAIDWERIPATLAARLDATLLDRAAILADDPDAGGDDTADAGGRTVLVTVAVASLRDPAFLARLGPILDRPAAASSRSRLVVLVRGGAGDLAAAADRLPPAWREHLGLRLTAAPADEAELERLLALRPGCLELDAPLLAETGPGGTPAARRVARLVARVAATEAPVVASGVVDRAALRRLRRHPVLFARGPLFGPPRDQAA